MSTRVQFRREHMFRALVVFRKFPTETNTISIRSVMLTIRRCCLIKKTNNAAARSALQLSYIFTREFDKFHSRRCR